MRKHWIFAFLVICAATASFGACHVITPSGAGSKNGSDWNDACAGFSGSCAPGSLTRGDSYYLAGGQYLTSGVTFNTAASGTSVITIKGATAADNCTSTGWSSSYDVSSTQATFNSNATFSGGNFGGGAIWGFSTPYWSIEGNTCNASAYQVYQSGGQGIFLDNSGWQQTTASMESEVDLGNGSNYDSVNNITFHCVDLRGAGVDSTSQNPHTISSATCSSGVVSVTTSGDHQLGDGAQVSISGVSGGSGFNTSHAVISRTGYTTFTYPSSSCSGSGSGGTVDGAYSSWEKGIELDEADNITFSQVTLRESANSPIQIYGGGGNWTWDHSAIRGYAGSAVNHSEAVTFQGGAGGVDNWTNATFSNSYFIDHISSGITGEIVPLYYGSITNLILYGNVFACTNYYDTGNCGDGNGIIACINPSTVCSNIYINNNTCYGLSAAGWVYGDSSGTQHVAQMQNNLGFNCPNLDDTGGGALTISGEDYNTILNGSGVSGGSHDYNQASGAANPFNVPSVTIPPMTSFELISETVDQHLNDGNTLPSPYNIDPAGVTRGSDGTWERGAYQYTGTQAQPPAVPTKLTATVQ